MGGLGSGKKKLLNTLMKDSIEQDRDNLPAYFDALSLKALGTKTIACPHCKGKFDIHGGGDKEALIYLINRHLGSPKQSIDARVRASREYSPEELALMRQPLLDQATLPNVPKLLTEVPELLNGCSETEVITDAIKQEEEQGLIEAIQVAQQDRS